MPPSNIAILGGGLSGLSAALHLARRYPTVPITLLEKSQRLGGWVRSERVRVQDANGHEASVLLEAGPRTLRPNGKSVLELINLLGLQSTLLKVSSKSPAARNRFLHMPGTKGLTVVPTSMFSMLSSPLAGVLIPAIAGAALRMRPLSPETTDQSVDAFLTSFMGEEFARTFGSALVHGIYATDARLLSIRAAFPGLWDAYVAGKGNLIRGFVKKAVGASKVEENGLYELDGLLEKMKGVSVYSFQDGMETITHALTRYLESRPNVEIVIGDEITSLRREAVQSGSDFKIDTISGRHINVSHVVSGLPLQALDRLTLATSSVSQLSQNPTSSVTVVNVVFPPTSFPIHPPGFGYLVPRLPEDATAEDQEDHAGVLGVVFDSCALPEQDQYASPESPRFTKITMMLGGPHVFSHTADSVTEDKLLRILTRHLAPPQALPSPVLIRARHLTECIPTPTLGHLDKVTELKAELRTSPMWEGRLEVIGAGVGGVSVPDCIEQGRHVGLNW